MITVTKRTLDLRTGSEGAPHDPYGYTEYIVNINGDKVVAHLGIVTWLKITPRDFVRPTLTLRDSEEQINDVFRRWTGIDLRDFPRYYERAHPYSEFEDSMGCPADYV